MFKIILCFIITLLLGICAFGQSKIVEIKRTIGSHSVKIIFVTKPFLEKQHKIRQVSDERHSVYGTWIDGKFTLGTDLSIPRTEVASISVYFDGKKVPTPRRLYSDCYEPNFGKDYFWLKFADDGKSVMAFMAASDAAGSYQVFWIFSKDGKHSRFSSKNSDVDYTDFAKGFFEDK